MPKKETIFERRVKFRHIQCFVEIAREGSLKRAAEKLYLTQPAISKTLKELEDIVDAKLMQRSRSGVTLTKQGEVFLHFAQMSLANLQQGVRGIETARQQVKTRLRVGSLPSVAASMMPEVVAEFSALAPDAMLQMLDGPHGYLIERLRLGELDVVIGRLGQPDTMQGISFTQLYMEQVDFVVRAGHPLLAAPDLHRIGEWQLIYPPAGSAIRPMVERFLIAHGLTEPPNRIETVSSTFGRVYTRQSDAIWVISSGVVANETADGTLVRLPIDTAMTDGPVGLMVRPDAPEMPVYALFRMAVQAAVERSQLAT